MKTPKTLNDLKPACQRMSKEEKKIREVLNEWWKQSIPDRNRTPKKWLELLHSHGWIPARGYNPANAHKRFLEYIKRELMLLTTHISIGK